jgi:hypothetical protein
VLVNVSDDDNPRPLGPLPQWVTKVPSPVDAVQDGFEGLVNPLPPFEACTFNIGGGEDDPNDVLVIRVYESTDTPHITSDGAIYVRGVAQDQCRDPIYRPAPVENQQALRNLVERGEQSSARVDELLRPQPNLPLANLGLGLQFERHPEGVIPSGDMPLIVARLAPHTLTGRFVGWARSHQAVQAAQTAIAELSGQEHSEVIPHGQGVALAGAWAPDKAPRTEHGRFIGGPIRMTVDAAGIVGASLGFQQLDNPEMTWPLTLEVFAQRYVAPALSAPASVLRKGSILGRVSCHVWFWTMGGILRIEHDGITVRPRAQVPFGGEITLPAEDGEIDRLAAEAARTFGRKGGVSSFEEVTPTAQ